MRRFFFGAFEAPHTTVDVCSDGFRPTSDDREMCCIHGMSSNESVKSGGWRGGR